LNPYLKILPEVQEAIRAGSPLLGLESTILTFGLPQPLNQKVGEGCQQMAAEQGAVPVTVAILEGQLCAGLSSEEIAYFCSRAPAIQKVNLQNLSAVLHARTPGALTVAASLQVCSLAGIQVFATGGIGGVHREYHRHLDISSDLVALARFPVATVCAGVKSILDVPATLEALESLGVPVVGFRTKTFPLFHARESRHRLEISFDDAAELAAFLRVHFSVSRGGVLVVTPVPESAAIELEQLEIWIERALQQADKAGIVGKQVTPYLLAELEKLSEGKTLKANEALILNNARVGAQIARALGS